MEVSSQARAFGKLMGLHVLKDVRLLNSLHNKSWGRKHAHKSPEVSGWLKCCVSVCVFVSVCQSVKHMPAPLGWVHISSPSPHSWHLANASALGPVETQTNHLGAKTLQRKGYIHIARCLNPDGTSVQPILTPVLLSFAVHGSVPFSANGQDDAYRGLKGKLVYEVVPGEPWDVTESVGDMHACARGVQSLLPG